MSFTVKRPQYAIDAVNITNLSCAFALRLINYYYRGPLIKVRRDSDNATIDIMHTGLTLDIKSLMEFVGAGSGFIDTWYDQSINANNLTQTVLARQPRIVNAGVMETLGPGGTYAFDLPTIRGFGAGASPIYLESATLPIVNTSEMAIYLVSVEKVRQASITVALAPASPTANRISCSVPNNTVLQLLVGNVASTFTTTIATGTPACYQFNTSAITNIRHIIRNDVIVSNLAAAAAQTATFFRVFSDGVTNFDGGISELLIFKAFIPGNGQRGHINKNQFQYYQIQNT